MLQTFYIHAPESGGDHLGPLTRAELLLKYRNGQISESTFVHSEGWDDWKAFGEIPTEVLYLHPEERSLLNKLDVVLISVFVGVAVAIALSGFHLLRTAPAQAVKPFVLEVAGPPATAMVLPVAVEAPKSGWSDIKLKEAYTALAALMELRGIGVDVVTEARTLREGVLVPVVAREPMQIAPLSLDPVDDASFSAYIQPDSTALEFLGPAEEGITSGVVEEGEETPVSDAFPLLTTQMVHRAAISLLHKYLESTGVPLSAPTQVVESSGRNFMVLLSSAGKSYMVFMRYEESNRFTFVDERYCVEVTLPVPAWEIGHLKFVNDWPDVTEDSFSPEVASQ